MYAAMKTATAAITILAAVTGASAATLDNRANGCAAGGVVNGQCGRVYSSASCEGTQLEQSNPDCSKTCYNVDQGFKSVKATGDGTHGTACYPFTGKDCQSVDEDGNTGLAVTAGDDKCETSDDTYYSYYCTFNC